MLPSNETEIKTLVSFLITRIFERTLTKIMDYHQQFQSEHQCL